MKTTRKVWLAMPAVIAAGTVGIGTGLGWAVVPASTPVPTRTTAPTGDQLRDQVRDQLHDGKCINDPDVTCDQLRDRDRLHTAAVTPSSVTPLGPPRSAIQVRAQDRVRTQDRARVTSADPVQEPAQMRAHERHHVDSPPAPAPGANRERVEQRHHVGR